MTAKRKFLSKAYLVEIEKGTFGLYRDYMETHEENGEEITEKVGKPLGPLDLFREASAKDKRIDMLTFHPTESRPISLVSLTKGDSP